VGTMMWVLSRRGWILRSEPAADAKAASAGGAARAAAQTIAAER